MNIRHLVRQIGKRVVKATPILRRHILPSTDYRVLGGIDEARRACASSADGLRPAPCAPGTRLSGPIAAMKHGEPRLDFRVAAEAVAATGIVQSAACSKSAAAAAIIRKCSPSCSRAASLYRHRLFRCDDRPRARTLSVRPRSRSPTRPELPYPDNAFDIVFNGVSLMHIIDYPAAIREAARVARRYCIFHSVPVFDDYRTTYLSKYAYGAPVVEIVFGKTGTDVALQDCRVAPGARMARHPL